MTEEVTQEVTEEVQAQENDLTVEVDGVQHKVSTLPADTQEMIRMHQAWNVDLARRTDKVNQTRAAVQQIATQVVESIRAATAEAATAETEEAPAAE